jgi:hypothetical protein
LAWSTLLELRRLLAKLLRLALATWTLTCAALTWAALAKSALSRSALSRSALPTLLSLLELRATLTWSAELLRLALWPWATLLSGAALTTLLPSRARSGAAGASIERLSALLGLPLTALRSAGLATRLAFAVLLLALVLGVFALRNDQTAICSTDAVKRDAELRNRNRRNQGSGEQDIAKLLQLPDWFEWQGALLRILKDASLRCAAAAPIRGTI